MYNILLTDDEQIVIDSIKFILDKNFAGQVEVSTALSGTEALDIASKQNIDIIFMDINMPGLNGLETISLIKKLRPNSVIIILSAFDTFQYAQEAMNLGAFKYITKPVNRNIIIQTIRSAMNCVDANRGQKENDEVLQKKLNFASPLIESDFIYACIYNYTSSQELSSYLDYFNLAGYPLIFCCFEFPDITPENQLLKYQKFRNIIKQNQKCITSTFMMNRIAVLFPIVATGSDSNASEENITQCISELFENLKKEAGNGLRAGVSSICSDVLMLSHSYNEAVIALNKTATQGGLLFTGRTSISQPEPASNSLSFKNQLLTRFKAADSKGVKELFELYSAQLTSNESDLNKIKNAFFELIVTARNIACEIVPELSNQSFSDSFSIMLTQSDIPMLKEFVLKNLLEYLSIISEIKTAKENPIVTKVCSYINENIEQDITLELMAEYTKVSSFYLSKLFKEEKGITFINYLNEARLEKAKDLLKNSSYSIKEITAAIGYNDQNYFSRIFRNKFGVTPTEFRSSI